ncbi:MAG: transglutaminase-like domain-containing protein [Novosphingobium sp.]
MSLPEPARWAIRTCPEADIVRSLCCWYYPSPRVTGNVEEAISVIAETLAKWRQLGLAFISDADGMRYYDPDEVINFCITAGLRGDDEYWFRFAAPLQIDMIHWFAGRSFTWQEVPEIRSLPQRGCRISFERTYHPVAETVGNRLRLKLPLPLASPGFQIDRLDLSSSEQGRLRQTGNFGELVIVQDEARPVTIAFTVDADVSPNLGTAEQLGEEGRNLYTARRENLIVVSPMIESLAETLAAGERDPEILVDRYYRYIIDQGIHGRVPYRALDSEYPTDWPLLHGYYDCQIGSGLLIALCRARAIPARLVNGYQIYHAYQANHFWAEVWLDGSWRPFDLCGWDAIKIQGGEGWLGCFAGQTEYRMPLQCFPRSVLGPSSISLRAPWQMILCDDSSGTTTHYRDAFSQRPIFQDSISVDWFPVEAL